jgi:exopolyphosphatase/guanosine-5'-triphosphate,3'-diphosphate pyrophosphatase
MTKRVAIIDMGTNTFHLLVAEAGNPPRMFYRDRKAVKIGQDGINAGKITPEGLRRAMATLKEFKSRIEAMKVKHVLAFGTSAIRSASNGNRFVQEIKEATGIETRIIDGEEEATLIYEGVRAALDLGDEKSLIVDVGGGSVEFIIANKNEIFWKESFEVGGQRLLEQFHRHDPILPAEVNEVTEYLTGALDPLFKQLAIHRPTVLVGVSGTFDTLSEMFCHETGITFRPDDPETPLTLESFHRTYDLLLKKTREERMAIPGMIEMRVDMIVVACCLVKLLTDKHALNSVRVSTWSLKEGALMKYLTSKHQSL